LNKNPVNPEILSKQKTMKPDISVRLFTAFSFADKAFLLTNQPFDCIFNYGCLSCRTGFAPSDLTITPGRLSPRPT